MSVFKYEKDDKGIVTITMDMTGAVNVMNDDYLTAMGETLDALEAEKGLTGVILTSAKTSFFAGADINRFIPIQKGDEEQFMALVEQTKAQLRRLEKLPAPVVAAINGTALGSGFEICLACNYRVILNHPSVVIGFPEVNLGLLPGCGGIVRLVNLIGLERALIYLIEGQRLRPEAALKGGLVQALANRPEELIPSAKDWILQHLDDASAALQPWDSKGFVMPGGPINSGQIVQLLTTAPALLKQRTRGLAPAPELILDTAVEAARLDFDTALRVESRGLTHLVTSPESKNLIAMLLQMNKVKSGASRPSEFKPWTVKKVGIVGASSMGAGIAYAAAMSGIEAILTDSSQEVADKGKVYSEELLSRGVTQGRISEAHKSAVLGLIKASSDDADLKGCDLIIESLFDDLKLKNTVTTAVEPYLSDDGFFGSNTAGLPITQLAEAATHPENFIGMHFFEPLNASPMVELVLGDKTSKETLAKAFDFVLQIQKMPIVVNDSPGFFTTRLLTAYLDEGVLLLNEGVHPLRIDNLGRAVGMAEGPLSVHDVISLEAVHRAQEFCKSEADKQSEQPVTEEVVNVMINTHKRGGRSQGGGFYDYHKDGSRSLWPKLLELYYQPTVDQSFSDKDIENRLLFRQVIEALKCLQEGVLHSVEDGNIGSLMGLGAPSHTGGLIQFINTFGLDNFISSCKELEAAYGERFQAPQVVVEKAKAGELFAA